MKYKLCDCGNIKRYINKNITIFGWINNIRYLKINNIIFIELKDNFGDIQIIINNNENLSNIIKTIKNESCIKVKGVVKFRLQKNLSKNKLNGEIEIICSDLILINKSFNIPFNINKFTSEQKLKYRYLYIRKNNIIYNNLLKRSNIIYEIHKFMNVNNFINIETPLLSKYFPEGSNVFLIKSNYNNKYYSLSQSPQIFKQILMISGFKKYYQISKCFRNEDLRSDRQPEFTQIDIEASFINYKYIIKFSEKFIKYLWKKINNIKLEKFRLIEYKDCIKKFGTDKPDLRNNIELYNIKDDLKININNKLNIYFIIIKEYFNLNDLNHKFNIEFIILNTEKLIEILNINYSIKKENIYKMLLKYNIKNSSLFLISYNSNIIKYIYKIREYLYYKLIDIKKINDKIYPIWIIKFPMFKKNKDGNISSVNHPFTKPIIKNIFNKKKNNNINNIYSYSYDLVINGIEIASGSERIHNYKIQEEIFNILNIDKNKYNFFIEALKYGAPPHAGIAFGLDRLTMLLTNTNDIKDTIAFPKTSSMQDIMINTPDFI